MTGDGARMSFIQRLVTGFVSRASADAMRASSLDWMIRCSGCGFERSVWESGGIRYKASGRPRGYRRCARCRRREIHEVYRKSGPAPGQPLQD
jgi:hypothetical protein